MESNSMQMENGEKNTSIEEKKGTSTVELPLESSPYLKYSDLEDYKLKAYGAQGHLEVKLNNHDGGGTDCPTLSGNDLSSGKAAIVDAANRQGIP